MTEQEWLSCSDPWTMSLWFLQERVKSDRKFRLYACASVRAIWHLLHDERSKQAVGVSERFADGNATTEDLAKAHALAIEGAINTPVKITTEDGEDWSAVRAANAVTHATREWGCASAGNIARHALGPERFIPKDPDPEYASLVHSASRTWKAQCDLLRDIFRNPFRPLAPLNPHLLTPRILSLARTVYEDRHMPQGTFDSETLLVLADALEEAGCDDPSLLAHLREPEGVHVRGCWVVDLLLGRS